MDKLQVEKSSIQTKSQPTPRVQEGYYLDNFLRLIDFVTDRYNDLLTEEEVFFATQFKKMSVDAQRLYVRLIMRKGPYFRKDKIQYSEINIENAIQDLVDNKYFVLNPREEPSLALQTFVKNDLLTIFQELLDVKSSISKDYLLFEIIETLDEEDIWKSLEACTDLIVPIHQEYIRLYKLLFFGNLRQGMEEFIFEDLGLMKFESYEIRMQDRFFDDREVVDAFFILSDLQYALWEMKSVGNVEDVISLGVALTNYEFPVKFEQKKEKLFLSIGSYLEKNKMLDEALVFFAQSSINPSKERMVRILDKQEKWNDSFELCSFLLDADNYYEREFAEFYIEKLKKKLGKEYKKNSRKKYIEQVVELENIPNERVEDAVLKHYHNRGRIGFYSESKIWSALTGIILWDIIFKARPNVFFNPFQRGPDDLFSARFYLENKDDIDVLFEALFYDENWQKVLLEKYKEKYLIANHLVDWKRVTLEVFSQVISHVSIDDIIHIAKRLITNPAEFRSGLPDLLLIDPAKNSYALVEVKGPGDQLQTNQRRWLNFFEENKIPYFVQKVKWSS